ncbi:MAG: HAMP domain-containing protein [Acidobacteriota bacterium]|nr:HAMP domain-containing protein [Acidobacteriota bacterium]
MLGGRSLRFRLTVWYACILAAALALFGGLIWFSLRQQLLKGFDRDLTDSAARFQTYFLRESAQESGNHLRAELNEFSQGLPDSTFLELSGGHGVEFRYADRAPSRPRHIRSIQTSFESDGETFHLTVGAATDSIHHTLELLRFLLIALIPVVVALACLGGGWISGRALRPVDELTSAAKSIGIENLSQRLPVPSTGDELQRLTEVWNEMLARLETAVTTLSQFAADASHELRTPLAVIRTNAEVALRRAREPDAYRESLREIEAEAERMTQLIEDLLFLARNGSGPGMPMRHVDLREVAAGVLNDVRDLATERDIHLLSELGERAAPLSGNAPALRRMLLALVDNALKYSPPGAEVHVSLESSYQHAAITVRDHGCGIPATDLPHIFKRFYRADPSRTGAGYGLGLSLASTIASLHGATIRVESTEGEGSVFTVEFPSREARIAA